MGRHVTSGPGRVVLLWCALYTLAVPFGERERRREEVTSYVWESVSAWGPGLRVRLGLVAATVRGAVDDLVWCSEVRAARGMRPLVAQALLGQVGATVIAGVAMTTTYVLGLSDSEPFPALRNAVALVAAAVTVMSLADRAARRWLPRESA